METPSVPFSVWPFAALDPVLILVAVWLGWKADQFGKVAIAVIAAVGISVLVSALMARLGIPWIVPVGGERPTLLPVRSVAAALWASAAYGLKRVVRRRG
jgi:hypothetical protein